MSFHWLLEDGSGAWLLEDNVAAAPPSAPTNLQMILQGNTTAGSTTSPPTPTAPNRIDIQWSAAVVGNGQLPVAYYRVYRSTNYGTFFAIADHLVLTKYSDTTATLCVNGTAGTTPPYYAATTYLYRVSAIDTAGVEGPQSLIQDFIIYKNGQFNWGGDFAFGGSRDYNDTSGSPQGGIADIKFTNSGFGGLLPFSGWLVTTWNMWVGGFNYLYMDLKPTNASFTFKVYALRVGDIHIFNAAGVSYNVNPMSLAYGPAPVVGQWSTRKIPLVDFLTDWGPSGAGPPVVQRALYKFAIQNDVAANGDFYADNLRLSWT